MFQHLFNDSKAHISRTNWRAERGFAIGFTLNLVISICSPSCFFLGTTLVTSLRGRIESPWSAKFWAHDAKLHELHLWSKAPFVTSISLHMFWARRASWNDCSDWRHKKDRNCGQLNAHIHFGWPVQPATLRSKSGQLNVQSPNWNAATTWRYRPPHYNTNPQVHPIHPVHPWLC